MRITSLSTLLFHMNVRCTLTTEEVRDFYRRGGPEAHESTDILFLSRAVSIYIHIKRQCFNYTRLFHVYKTIIKNTELDIPYIKIPSFSVLQKMLQLSEHSPLWSEMCPSAKGAVLLYQRVMPDY
ncbi:Nucleoside diphosphate-linked moiety X motif 22 [Anabarilius grahami]|uniref:Nucleoside diphosphate-linked moiety X motif 22 n=1 Tax=Anabarilius grahami TaxID=495550 RepID=A0A3N0ZBA0_ANAGA|nr:Nucleoside diphosphate-linked moiety X motif 22 [Anabarilius grahami]